MLQKPIILFTMQPLRELLGASMAELLLRFSGASQAEGNRLAPKLEDALTIVAGLKTEIRRERQDAQDAGAILSVVLGAPAIIAAVKAIGAWLARNNQAGLDISLPNGSVVIKNMKSEDVPKAIAALEKIVAQGGSNRSV